MTEKTFLAQIMISYIMLVLFFLATVHSVAQNGWQLFSFLFAYFATREFVRATKMLQIYIKIKKSSKP